MGETAEKPKLTEQDFNLLTQARDEFNEKSYERCLKTLEHLEQSIGSNPKLSHNKAIVEFYKSDCVDYKSLLNFLEYDLNDICRKSNDPKTKYLPAAIFNKSVIYYHLRKPFAALEMLTPIMENMEDLDESLIPKAGLLMLVLLLTTNQISKAFKFLKRFQTYLGISLETIAGDENASPESLSNIDDFKRMFKLIAMLTNVMNHENIIVPDDGSVEFAVLKAHQYYVGKDFQMAAKQLSKKFTLDAFNVKQYGEDQDTCIANNMGVIHLRVKHYAIAAKFFQHAITFDNKIATDMKEVQLHCLGATKKPEILYNLGVAMLHLHRPREAFECFLVPLKIYHNNPRLWLRVAESCILLHEKTLKENEKRHIISAIIGTGMHRKYLLEPSPKIKTSVDGQSFAIPNPNLEFAALCLRNAAYLIENCKKKFYLNKTEDDQSEDDNNWSDTIDENFCNPSIPVSKESFNELIATIYAAYSYVLLRLGEFTLALEYAKKLLLLENLSDANAMLGHLYCAEALIMLNRVAEARTHLEPNFVTNINVEDFETKNWSIKSVDAVKSIMRYNLVVTLVLQHEFDVAKALLSTCVHPVVATKVKMLKMFLEIAGGTAENNKPKFGRF